MDRKLLLQCVICKGTITVLTNERILLLIEDGQFCCGHCCHRQKISKYNQREIRKFIKKNFINKMKNESLISKIKIAIKEVIDNKSIKN